MKQPKLRFKANDGNQYPEWEEKRLEEVAVRITRKNKDNCTDIPLTISSLDGLIDQRDFFNKIVASKDMSGYYLLKRGEFAYNKSYSKGFDFGSIKRLNLYDEGALSTLYICFALNNNEDSDFYQKYFDSLSWYPELQKICAEGARNHGLLNVSTNDFFQLKLHVPKSKEEQQEIASLFTELDNLIQSAQKELDGYRELKQGMLQKMFPKKGEKVPEIRFPEFTDNWEQRKLTEFVEFFSGLTYTPNDVQKNGTLVLRSSNVSNGEVVDADNVYVNPQVVNSENVKVGDIVVVVRNGSRSLIGKHAQIKAIMPNTVIGAFMTGIRSECPAFINALLNTSRFEKEIAMNMGATINQITGYMFSKMEFKVPCLDEQKKIGEYFSNLDNLIALQQRELDGYKELKKGLLQQMFC